MRAIVHVDSKGRILIPHDIRERVGIKPGSKLLLEVKNGEIVLRVLLRDPSDELSELLGDFEFNRECRRKAEKYLIEELPH